MMKNLQFGLILLCLLFFFSCQKEEAIIQEDPVITTEVALENIIDDDPLMDKFFNGINDHDVPVSTDKKATVDRIKLAMAEDHKTTPFVGDYIRQVGFPLWGQAKLHRQAGNDQQLYILPFASSNSTATTAIMYVFVHENNFVYELGLRTDVVNYIEAYNAQINTFYWENFLSFVIDFTIYDDLLFDFEDAVLSDWYDSNEETYLTDAADTRSEECFTATRQDCKRDPITLQENGHERSCPPGYREVTIIFTVCVDFDQDVNPIGPHTPGGQTGGVPGIGGGGGSNSSGDGGPGNAPGIDPGTWGDETGGNSPNTDITEIVCIYNATSTFLQTYEIQATTEIRDILSNIVGCEEMSQETFNQLAIGELIRDQGAEANSGTINILSGAPQSLAWVLNNIENVDILNSLTNGNLPLTPEIQAGGEFFLHSMKNNLSTLPADDPNLNTALEQFWPGPVVPTLGLDLASQVEQEVMFLREVHKDDPSWTNSWLYAHAIKKVFSGTTHTLLQLCGLIEGPGIICDGIDALFYLAEGDGKNAAMSSFAMVPFLGMTAPGQRAYKRITSALGGTAGLRFGTNAAGAVVDFGRSCQLKTVIGRIPGHQAHHIIPFANHTDNQVLQLAARHGWHPNDFINGINLPIARHSGNHPTYTTAVLAKLDEIRLKAGTNGAETVQLLDKFTADLFGVIQSSTAHINSTTMAQLVNGIPIP